MGIPMRDITLLRGGTVPPRGTRKVMSCMGIPMRDITLLVEQLKNIYILVAHKHSRNATTIKKIIFSQSICRGLHTKRDKQILFCHAALYATSLTRLGTIFLVVQAVIHSPSGEYMLCLWRI